MDLRSRLAPSMAAPMVPEESANTLEILQPGLGPAMTVSTDFTRCDTPIWIQQAGEPFKRVQGRRMSSLGWKGVAVIIKWKMSFTDPRPLRARDDHVNVVIAFPLENLGEAGNKG